MSYKQLSLSESAREDALKNHGQNGLDSCIRRQKDRSARKQAKRFGKRAASSFVKK